MSSQVVNLNQVSKKDTRLVGGKNASLGEMLQNISNLGILVPQGFAVTTEAYKNFLKENNLAEPIKKLLEETDVNDVVSLRKTSHAIKELISEAKLSDSLISEIKHSYQTLSEGQAVPVAVRSSAVGEDSEDTSFAGQQDSYLNIVGEDEVLAAVKAVFGSLYNERAIAYRAHQNAAQAEGEAISVGIQRMVDASNGASGVAFTIDPESGFREVVLINAAYGLGEMHVQGRVNPDEYYFSKKLLNNDKPALIRKNLGTKQQKMIFSSEGSLAHSTEVVDVDRSDRQRFALNDQELTELAHQAMQIEAHYGQPVDIEWAKDGTDGKIYILQARPETVKSRQNAGTMERYLLKQQGKVLCEGRSIGHRIGAGKVCIVENLSEIDKVQPGDVIVSDMTDPDWEPVMKMAAGIVTNRGGRTCHAAIIARELGIPAIVGCGNATEVLKENQAVTVSCAEGDTGYVYEGMLDFEVQKNSIESMPSLPFKIMMNVGNPDRAFDFAQLPNQGVGLARVEFIINRMIGVHPKALLNVDTLPRDIQHAVLARSAGYPTPVDFFVDKLAEGIATLAVAFDKQPVIVRMSDFKSNEYANLIGGKLYEPHEENPMLGFRGASRYISESFRDCFELECRAIKKVRDEMGLTNVLLMIPFVRTLAEAKKVIELLDANGLKSGQNGLQIIMMCELPTNALLADRFLEYFDGFSIGSNDLTQLTLGIDRDSGIISHLFDERDLAIKTLMSMAIHACRRNNKYIGICGQGPSDHPDFALWLMEQGISSVSLNPDSVMDTWFFLAEQLQNPHSVPKEL